MITYNRHSLDNTTDLPVLSFHQAIYNPFIHATDWMNSYLNKGLFDLTPDAEKLVKSHLEAEYNNGFHLCIDLTDELPGAYVFIVEDGQKNEVFMFCLKVGNTYLGLPYARKKP